ncbi:HNH endonuclease [Pseudopelagicola sp. nBUS_19]|uniref:HNH endonuclease n=1 Tax=Pseudopelagicola sp. nBUS_19 TaxID=3395316 RepID=UPI003EB9BFC6
MTPQDFGIFERYKNAPANAYGSKANPASHVSDEDKMSYAEIHDTLKEIVENAIDASNNVGSLKLKKMNFSHRYGSRGHRPVDLWMSVCGVESDAFGKMPQVYAIASERGVEIGFAVAIDEADYHDPNVKARNRDIIPQINSKLPQPNSTLSDDISSRLKESRFTWQFSKKARLGPGDDGFNQWPGLDGFLKDLRGNGMPEGGGSIAHTIDILDVSDETINQAFNEALELFEPLLLACQPNSVEQGIIEIEDRLGKQEPYEAFDPTSIADGRTLVLRSIATRRGQANFRGKLLSAYQFKCAISRTGVTSVLEAAHIIPYRGPATNHVGNGILMRADLHTLYDLGMISIDPKSFRVAVAPALLDSPYKAYHNIKLLLPEKEKDWPSSEALASRNAMHVDDAPT